MKLSLVSGDLLTQPVDAIVNPWNKNLIPWWLLMPHGVSGAIKKSAGYKPFIELRRSGTLSLGSAVATSAGRLPFKAIIHVASIGHNWCSSEQSIRLSVNSALEVAKSRGFNSIAFPLIGAGVGGQSGTEVQQIIEKECRDSDYGGEVLIVLYKPQNQARGHCNCNIWGKSPDTLRTQGIPDGYCGWCDVCGKPGHVQHFPGAVPFTGAWCRKHYYRTMITHPLGAIGFFVWIVGIFGLSGLIIMMW